MTPQELKNSILQLAVQGKLVEQRPEEGTGEELYRQIQKEKQKLIKEGKIKKEKPLPEISEDEISFEIPENWKWVRLRSLGTFSSGKTPTMGESKYWDNGTVSWITSKDMKEKYLNCSEILITDAAASEMKMYPENTILMVVRSGILKRMLPVAILTGESTINQDIKALSLHIPSIAEYVYCILKGMETYILKEYRKQVTTVDSLRFENFQNMPVPLPPLAEQKRIVAKIEELLPYIDRYEKAWSRLEDFNKRFPVDMQKSILQMAIQGKLVEQRPEEGTGEELYQQIQAEKRKLIKAGKIKKEKPLPEISEDEIPFEIPESWKWVYIGELFQHNTGKALNCSNQNGRPLEYITTSNVYWNRFEISKLNTMLFTDAEIEKCTVQKGDLLVLEGGDIGRAAIWNYEFPMRIQNHIHRLRPYGNLCIEFFYHIFFLYKNTGLINGKGIGIKGLSANVLHSLIVPLPPLAEQKRIVAKLEKILPLCERLK